MKKIASGKFQNTAFGLILLSAAGMIAIQPWQYLQGPAAAAAADENDDPAIQHANALSRAFRRAAEKALPTVVTIRTRTKSQPNAELRRVVPEGEIPEGENPFEGTPFEDFFRDREGMFRFQPRVPQRNGLGSGVIIDPSGIIVTNNHVVTGADEVMVYLADGRRFEATDIKTDEETDLAIVRIQVAESLPAARLGNSDEMEIGDWVIAVGNPFEQELSVSAGIISGKGRDLGSVTRAKFLQTDAAINPGNSGGPLVNLSGEVVGINTAIASNNGGYQGIGFAIPANLAKWVVPQLVERGAVERAFLGVSIAEITSELAEQFDVRRGSGVLVAEVFPDTPAAEAGFEEGDIVTAFAGNPVDSPRKLQEMVERSPLDSTQRVNVLRGDREVTLNVTVKPLPDQVGPLARRRSVQRGEENENAVSNETLGVEVTELSDAVAEQLDLEGYEGVVISDVEPGGAAAAVGLSEGMLIMRVGRNRVKTVEEFNEAIENESLEDGILLHIRTSGGNRFIVIEEP